MHCGQGAGGAPHGHVPGPIHGRSGCAWQTQPMSLHAVHLITVFDEFISAQRYQMFQPCNQRHEGDCGDSKLARAGVIS